MPTAIKKRKVSATRAKSTLPLPGVKPSTIDSFARVTKAGRTLADESAKKACISPVTVSLEESPASNGKKRRSEDDEDATLDYAVQILETTPDRYVRPARRSTQIQPTKHLLRTPRKPITTLESVETPTKGARGLLDRLYLSSETSTRSPLSSTQNSEPERSELTPLIKLPYELLDLINLHAAFLTALSLHYAHNGTESPADLRLLCPDVARAWGKRGVTIEDIQRTIGILNSNTTKRQPRWGVSTLSLSDYGHRKICVEIEAALGPKGGLGRPINEDVLNEIFVESLRDAWEERPLDMDWNGFIGSLPLEPITLCPSLVKMSPLLMKGKERLQHMRQGILEKTEATKENVEVASIKPKNSLLERLRAKQALQSSLPPPPSATEISRQSALQKIDEVIAVLTILSTSSSLGQQRVSFTLPTVFGKLKDSLKTPMSKKESDVCVRLLAEEIAPEWVRLAKMGKVEALVFDREGKLSGGELRARVLRAGGKGLTN